MYDNENVSAHAHFYLLNGTRKNMKMVSFLRMTSNKDRDFVNMNSPWYWKKRMDSFFHTWLVISHCLLRQSIPLGPPNELEWACPSHGSRAAQVTFVPMTSICRQVDWRHGNNKNANKKADAVCSLGTSSAFYSSSDFHSTENLSKTGPVWSRYQETMQFPSFTS